MIRQKDQGNKMENPDTEPKINGKLGYEKGTSQIVCVKDVLVNKWLWENGAVIWGKKHKTRSISYHA